MKPYGKWYATVAHFRLDANPILQPISNQVRTLFGYGSQNTEGFSAAAGISYDFTNDALQSQLVQVSYNGTMLRIVAGIPAYRAWDRCARKISSGWRLSSRISARLEICAGKKKFIEMCAIG